MASVIDGRPGLSIGRVFSQAFAAIGSNPGTFFGVPFLLGALPSAIIGFVERAAGITAVATPRPTSAALGIAGVQFAGGVLAFFFILIAQGALVRATVAHAEARRAPIGECIAIGVRAALPLFGLTILLSLGVGFASLLLLVPGIILWLMWSVAAPALVEEGLGVFDSFGRSRGLTKGARWKIFGLELVIGIVVWLFYAAFGILMFATLGFGGMANMARTMQNGLPIGLLIGQLILTTIVTAFWSATQNSLYVELRRWKDGFTPERLAEVFS